MSYKLLYPIICYFIFLVPVTFAQTVIKGRIIDGSTQEALLGASVILEGDLAGVATDATGSFILRTNQLGRKSLVISLKLIEMIWIWV
jgi:uncharacterized membrane protein